MTRPQRSIEDIIDDMTVAEKIGQMTQVSNEDITPSEVADHFIGSVLSGGNGNPQPNTPAVWTDMVSSYVDASTETRLGIPLIYGVDAVHGHGNVAGATVFPHNIGLGAAADAALVEQIGRATAIEMQATGIRWAFAPTLAVPHDIRWGRTYEGYGRDTSLVSSLGSAQIRGLQGSEPGAVDVLACVKHFVGDGATSWGTAPRYEWTDWWDGWGDTWQIDQGDARITEAELRTTHLAPYRTAIEADALTAMVSYSSWNGDKLHSHRHLLTDVLKTELGFRGFVVSDWKGVDQVAPRYEDAVVACINAGLDMVMVPDDFEKFIDVMLEATLHGRIPMSRIDDAVRRILTAKRAVGLFAPDADPPPLSAVGAAAHRAIAAEAVRRSAVLLKNDRAVPLDSATLTIDVAGVAANDIGLQCGGWTVGWQGGTGSTTPGSTILDGLRSSTAAEISFDADGHFPGHDRCDVGVVCLAEPPYAEGPGDRAEPALSDQDRAVFERIRLRADKVVLVVYSGRPLIIDDLMDRADAVVAAWLPGSEGAALGELLAGAHPFMGRTPQPWPRSFADLDDPEATPLFPTGHGLGSTLTSIGGRP